MASLFGIDALILARAQFGFTVALHIIFPARERGGDTASRRMAGCAARWGAAVVSADPQPRVGRDAPDHADGRSEL